MDPQLIILGVIYIGIYGWWIFFFEWKIWTVEIYSHMGKDICETTDICEISHDE